MDRKSEEMNTDVSEVGHSLGKLPDPRIFQEKQSEELLCEKTKRNF